MNRRLFSRTAAGLLGAAMLPGGSSRGNLRSLMSRFVQAGPRVDAARIQAHLTALGEFGRNPEGGVSRVAYTEFDRQGREAVMAWMREAGLEVSVDAAANLVGRRAGSVAGLRPILIGSHVDSVPSGGNFDGQVGSMGAIEVARTLAASGTALRHPLEVCIWSNEEGGTIGSHAVASGLTAAELDRTSQSGKTIREGIAFLGGDPAKLGAPLRQKGDIAGYLELHIEQGGFLDERKLPIGVVEGIVGIRRWDVTLTGFGNHAGTTPMNRRKDALLAAARCIEAVNRIVTSVPGRQVGTVGKIRVEPGAYNVIPARAVFGVELRDLDDGKVLRLWGRIQAECVRITRAGGVGFAATENPPILPALTDPGFRTIIAESARALGLATLSLPSGAGHDAQEIARIGPVGMIFVPSVGGISHSPKEFTRPEDVENGANVLLEALLRLDRM
jgi:beta-ureidopropionase / N-carbamoyl-L-amino-acid hydrolase